MSSTSLSRDDASEKHNEKQQISSPAATAALSDGPPRGPPGGPPPTPVYPSGKRFAITLAGLCSAVFCVALDNTILTTAVPRITDDFHTLQDVGWYGSGEQALEGGWTGP
jgi:hypothetical protein